jgi:hypothetical protein
VEQEETQLRAEVAEFLQGVISGVIQCRSDQETWQREQSETGIQKRVEQVEMPTFEAVGAGNCTLMQDGEQDATAKEKAEASCKLEEWLESKSSQEHTCDVVHRRRSYLDPLRPVEPVDDVRIVMERTTEKAMEAEKQVDMVVDGEAENGKAKEKVERTHERPCHEPQAPLSSPDPDEDRGSKGERGLFLDALCSPSPILPRPMHTPPMIPAPHACPRSVSSMESWTLSESLQQHSQRSNVSSVRDWILEHPPKCLHSRNLNLPPNVSRHTFHAVPLTPPRTTARSVPEGLSLADLYGRLIQSPGMYLRNPENLNAED